MRDVLPKSADVPYGFIGAPPALSHDELRKIMRDSGVQEDDEEAVQRILLWFGFIGVYDEGGESKYIYSYSYDFKLFLASISKLKWEGISYQVNPAFWSALGIQSRHKV